jgi:hypothetical protein
VRPEPWHSSAEGKFQSKLKREAGEKSIWRSSKKKQPTN